MQGCDSDNSDEIIRPKRRRFIILITSESNDSDKSARDF